MMSEHKDYIEFLCSTENILNAAGEVAQRCSAGLIQESLECPPNEKIQMQRQALLWSRLTHAISAAALCLTELNLANGYTLKSIRFTSAIAASEEEDK
jgi:hypothetical protein